MEVTKEAGIADEAMLDGTGLRFGLVVSRYNEAVSKRLLDGALTTLRKRGVLDEDLHVSEVPGAWEIPTGLSWLARSRTLDGLIAIGVVIRGETPHFEYVCRGCTDGCERLARELDLPIGFGVLTCDDAEQAGARAGGPVGNKGEEAALAALEMANLKRWLIRPALGHL